MFHRVSVIAFSVLGIVSGADVDLPTKTHLRRAAPRVERIDELELVTLLLRNSTTRVHLREVQDRLVPILSALPAERPGYVGHRVARYALVRYFLVYRRWLIKGLSREAGVWNEYPAEAVLKSRFPYMVLRFINEILGRPLIGMTDLAEVVAAVETLVYSNVKDVLLMAYGALELSVEAPLRDPDQQFLVMQTFTMLLVVPGSQADIVGQPVESLLQDLRESESMKVFWVQIEEWVADTWLTTKPAVENPFSKGMGFASMLAMAEVVSANIGDTFTSDCLSMKHLLMDMDTSGAGGRISLADFYQPQVEDEHWEFRESPKYLEALGALDTSSTPRNDHVLIPNYVTAPTNCLDSSTFHQLCCLNECELLLMHVEAAVGKPDVMPAALLKAVAVLPSDTVRAPRNLSESLQNRLFEISRMRDGTVPIHGHMFSEWMHRAFPNECPMPGGMRLRKDELKEVDLQATKQEIEEIVRKSSPNHTDHNTDDLALQKEYASDGLQMPWSDTEELLTEQDWEAVRATEEEKATATGRSSTSRSGLRPLMIVAAITASVYILAEKASLWQALRPYSPKRKATLPIKRAVLHESP